MLFGRKADCAAVEGLTDAAGSWRSGAPVVRAEPNVGKSALLKHAIEQATKMRVLRRGGIEAESELAFAALTSSSGRSSTVVPSWRSHRRLRLPVRSVSREPQSRVAS